jgi:hypothetical protein
MIFLSNSNCGFVFGFLLLVLGSWGAAPSHPLQSASLRARWEHGGRVDRAARISVTGYLQHADGGEALREAVRSGATSLTDEQVADLVRPKEGAREAFLGWVERGRVAAGVHSDEVSVTSGLHGDVLVVDAPAAVWEEAANGLEMHAFAHRRTGTAVNHLVGLTARQLPRLATSSAGTGTDENEKSGEGFPALRHVTGLADVHLADVLLASSAPVSEGDATNKIPSVNPIKFAGDAALDFLLTPSSVRRLYGIPQGSRLLSPMGIVTSSAHNATLFQRFVDELLPNSGARAIISAATGAGAADPASAASRAADLAVQFAAGMTGTDSVAHWAFKPGSQVILEWAKEVGKLKVPLPLVVVMTHTGPSGVDCNIREDDCVVMTKELSTSITASDVELMKLAVKGVTVVAPSGYDGAPGFEHDRCPSRFNNNCHAFTITNKADSRQCVLPEHGRLDSLCTQLLANKNCTIALENFQIKGQGEACNLTIDATTHEMRATCACADLNYETYGDCVVGPDDPTPDEFFQPGYPASSPYVVSVGTTRLTRWRNRACAEHVTDKLVCELGEVTAATDNGVNVTSGGGFSKYAKVPDHQKAFLQRYQAVVPRHQPTLPEDSFDVDMRGFPDVSAIGVNCLAMLTGHNDADVASAGQYLRPSEQAACSAVVVGSLLALVAERHKLKLGSGLGLAGPKLYKAADLEDTAFFDIVGGNNSCTRSDCCRYGFQAVPGWDPVTGLGTPNFRGLMKGIFPDDYRMPPYALTPGVNGPVHYASKSQLPWLVLPFAIIGFIASAALIVYFAKQLSEWTVKHTQSTKK